MPDWKPEIRRRLASLRLSPTREAAIVEELAQDLDDCYAESLNGGASEAEAYRAALAELSESELLARELRRVERQVAPEPIILGTNRRTNMFADLWQDLRFGARLLRKRPGFTLGVALSLMLGIGLNTTIFSVVNALLLAPLPGVAQPRNLVGIYSTRQGSGYFNLAYPDFAYFQENNQSFSNMAAHWHTPFALGSSGDPIKVDGAIVTGNYFAALGLNPALGRFFLPEEDRTPGAHPVAVVSHKLWQRHFNADPQVIGKTIALNGQGFTVVGVAPAGFSGTLTGLAAELWVPLMMHAVALPGEGALARGPNMLYLMAFGRLKPGVGEAPAQTATAPKVAIINEITAQKYFPNVNPVGQPLPEELRQQERLGRDVEIVGVARSFKRHLRQDRPGDGLFIPYTQAPPEHLGQIVFYVRATGNPVSLIPALRQQARAVEPDLALLNPQTITAGLEQSVSDEQALATLLSFFSALALALAGIGLYGTMSYAVSRRTKELGIRMALGARPRDVLWLVLREALLQVALGVVIGAPLGLAGARLIASLLFGVRATDPMTISISALVMLTVALLAGYIPARRAMKVDPLVALRHD